MSKQERHSCILAVLAALLLPVGAFAADGASIRIPRVNRPPKLRDFLSGTPREAEAVVTDFRQFSPGDGEPVSQPTTAYLSYDDKNLYVVFVCKDEPSKIRARMAKREQIMKDDRITVNLDTFHDHQRAYWFDVNPLGVQADGNVTDGVEDDTSWDTLWFSDARLTPDGYVAMVTVPFRSLRFPSSPNQRWGLVLGRLIQRNNEFATWPHISKSRRGWVQQGGDLEGIENISAGRNLQFIPYGLFSRARFLETPEWGEPGFRTQTEKQVGLDAKIVLKDSFTLDVALNPDFSQVESDEPQVTINQRYEVFFPEKRPFFLDNAGFFKTPQQLFFSRRIADPELGMRFTGKAGRWALGALAVDDRAPGKRVSPADPLYNDHSAIGVFRASREFLRDSSAGVLVTSQDFGSGYNRVYAFDTRLKVRPNWVVNGQAMSSETRLLDGRRLAGPAWYGELAHAGRHFIWRSIYTDRSPGFRAQLGYIPRVDIREAQQIVGYRWRPENSGIVSFGPQVKTTLNYNREGRVQDWVVNPEFVLELPRLTELAVEHYEAFELFQGHGFRKFHREVGLQTEWLKWLALEAEYSRGTSINFYPAPGRKPFLARLVEGTAGFIIRPNSRMRLDETYIYNSLTARQGSSPAGVTPGSSIFNNHIFRSKLNYQFNRELSLRAIVDYNGVLPNAALVDLEREKHLGVDVLLTWMLNPGTAFHVGYTDLYDNIRLNPMISPALKRTDFPDTSTGRQFFIKLSYLLRM